MNQLTSNVQASTHNHIAAGRVDFFPRFPDHIDQVVLSTSSSTYTVPTGGKFAIFSCNSDFAARADNDAVFPVAGVTNGSGSLLNPAQFDISGLTSIGFISNTDAVLTIAVFG
jgi:hypothetical protein